ncbi:pyridoxal-phosphate dependent enzyme [Aerococcaceae bacterium WS4759]|uniref:Pyridoxal-phosphate dependent enzyme n=2 Tax=Fundicoccus ignavus TaxID=2664442 RepID=A0A6I2GJ73_9LACT|nr:pyridoxal-phosphate dependent enzyme [Fundicoccus ignavus]
MQHSSRNNQLHDVYYYSVLQKDFQNKIVYPEQILSGIDYLYNDDNDNSIYIKRDDMLSFSFGGNKARKAKYFFDEIKAKNFNVVITYGSKVSNHCRVISNMCSKLGIKCIIVSPISIEENNFNRTLIKLANAEIIECDVSDVSTTIENIIEKEKQIENQSVYFIPGGGHGNHGTQAYVDAYHEIVYWSRKNNKKFDYIFVASGTGTTQAGLIVGNLMHRDSTQIIGISIAREESVGKKVILDSVDIYFEEHGSESLIQSSQINFTDKYINRIYGQATDEIYEKIYSMYIEHGIQFNSVYTGKGFVGMEHFIKENNIKHNNILFIHTGGTPLFFEDLKKLVAE